jgi:hypothetical protein
VVPQLCKPAEIEELFDVVNSCDECVGRRPLFSRLPQRTRLTHTAGVTVHPPPHPTPPTFHPQRRRQHWGAGQPGG